MENERERRLDARATAYRDAGTSSEKISARRGKRGRLSRRERL